MPYVIIRNREQLGFCLFSNSKSPHQVPQNVVTLLVGGDRNTIIKFPENLVL